MRCNKVAGLLPAQSLTSKLGPRTGWGQVSSSPVVVPVDEVVDERVLVELLEVVEEETVEDVDEETVEVEEEELEELVVLLWLVVELLLEDEEVVVVVPVTVVVVVVEAMHSYWAKYMNSQPLIQTLASSPSSPLPLT